MRDKVLRPSGTVKCNNLPMFRQLLQTAVGSLAFKLGAAFVLVVLVAVGGMGVIKPILVNGAGYGLHPRWVPSALSDREEPEAGLQEAPLAACNFLSL